MNNIDWDELSFIVGMIVLGAVLIIGQICSCSLRKNHQNHEIQLNAEKATKNDDSQNRTQVSEPSPVTP